MRDIVILDSQSHSRTNVSSCANFIHFQFTLKYNLTFFSISPSAGFYIVSNQIPA